MGFIKFLDWWICDVVAGPIMWSMDTAFSLEYKYGEFVCYACAAALWLPAMAITCVAMGVTAFLLVASVILSPLIIPFTVWAHRRKRTAAD